MFRRFFLMAGLLFIAFEVQALQITEIMYDPEGSDSVSPPDWVEVYNDSNSDVDLTDWRVGKNDGAPTITIRGEDGEKCSAIVAGGDIVIFTQSPDEFKDAFSNFAGVVYKVGLGRLHNTEGRIEIEDGNGGVEDSVSYKKSDGASADGDSLHISGSTITAGPPTPGEHNGVSANGNSECVAETGTSDSTPSSSSSSSSSSRSSSKDDDRKIISRNIITEDYILRNVPTDFFVEIEYDDKYKKRSPGFYNWNSGDGSPVSRKSRFAHTYRESGTYIVTAQSLLRDSIVIEKMVNILEPDFDLIIERQGGKTVVEKIQNNHSFSVSLDGWYIEQGDTIRELPKLLKVAPNSSIPVNISFYKKDEITLNSPTKKIITYVDLDETATEVDVSEKSEEPVVVTVATPPSTPPSAHTHTPAPTADIISVTSESVFVESQNESISSQSKTEPSFTYNVENVQQPRSISLWLTILIVLVLISIAPLVISAYMRTRAPKKNEVDTIVNEINIKEKD